MNVNLSILLGILHVVCFEAAISESLIYASFRVTVRWGKEDIGFLTVVAEHVRRGWDRVLKS
jgi:hypothetical protein